MIMAIVWILLAAVVIAIVIHICRAWDPADPRDEQD